MKIGLLSLPVSHNYGHVLQIFALYRVLSDLGHEPILLNRRWNNISEPSLMTSIKRFVYQEGICYHFTSFIRNNLNVSKEVRGTQQLKDLSKKLGLEAIIVGSDQVWRIESTRGADLNFFLDFAEGEKKISYAASFGTDSWSGSSIESCMVKNLLSRFDSVSVREQSGVSLCKEVFGIQAKCVLDPTLLLDRSIYQSLGLKVKSKATLATYILDSSDSKIEFIEKVASKLALKTNCLYKGDKLLTTYLSVRKWLSSIMCADYVIVDSFHGMVFSIIFEKQFIVICNKKRGATRFISLLSQLGLEDRMIEDCNMDIDGLLSRVIDYKKVNVRLQALRCDSYAYLIGSLK